ncbi:MAG: alpha/beta hydrolase [Chloroflexota bacterium]
MNSVHAVTQLYEVVHYPAQGEPFPHPLLFVHGAWHGAWCWEQYFMPHFAAHGFDVTAFSLRGHGSSTGRHSIPILRLADYVDDLRILLAQFETPPVLIGHSMGALLIQKVLETHHDIPAAVMLAPIPHTGTIGLAWRTATRRPLTALRIMLTGNVYTLVADPEPDGTTFFSPYMPSAEAERYMQRFTHESFIATGFDALFFDLPRPVRAKTPVLVLAGRHDTLFTPKEIQRTASAYDTQAIVFEQMGHELMLDPGWQDVATTIDTWLYTMI